MAEANPQPPGGGTTVDVREVRTDPARFVGPVVGGAALDRLALELVALSVMESLRQPAPPPVRVTLLGPRRLRVADAGRGMAMHAEPGHACSHAEYALTRFYPVAAPSEIAQRVLTRLVWGARGSVGPVVVNALSAELEMSSIRGGVRRTLRFEKGRVQGPAAQDETAEPPGTQITFTPDPELLGRAELAPSRLAASLAELETALGVPITLDDLRAPTQARDE